MSQFLRKYNKRLLAFFGVFLMIAFLLPASFSPGTGARQVVGEAFGGEKVHLGSIENSYREWQFVNSAVIVPTGGGVGRDGRPIPEFVPVTAISPIAELAGQSISEHKALYFLLLREAERLGIRATPEHVDAVMEQVRLVLPDGRQVAYSDPRVRESRQGSFARYAVGNLLTVDRAFGRVLSAMKVSQPARAAWLAQQMQAVDLRYVVFPVDEFLAQTPTPSTEQLTQQFESFADRLPGNPTIDNPFGFGYRYPNRVKIQYLAVTRDQLRRAVLENPQIGDTPEAREHYWQKEAYKYFLNNREQFAVPPPATQPEESAPISLGGAAPTTAPAAVEFTDAVREIATEALIRPEIDALARKVQGRITAALNTDYANYARAVAAKQAPPGTPFSAAYDSLEYLHALANEVQNQFGVLPTVVNLGDRYRSEPELSAEPGISTVMASVGGRPMTLSGYAFASSGAFADPNARDRPSTLDPFEPSQVMSDMIGGGLVIFRITSADASHRPASLDEVKERVESDVRRTLAYEAARAAATELVRQAGDDLSSAAASKGKTVHAADDLRLARSVPQLEGVASLSPFAQDRFAAQVFDLLSDLPDSANGAIIGHPALIDLQPAGAVLAAQIVDVTGDLPGELLPLLESQMTQQLTAEIAAPAAMAWFDWDNVVKRTGFTGPGGR